MGLTPLFEEVLLLFLRVFFQPTGLAWSQKNGVCVNIKRT